MWSVWKGILKMENSRLPKPNFMVLKLEENRGPIYKVTICKNTLKLLGEELINEIPKDWSVHDFYDLIEEGKRFFGR